MVVGAMTGAVHQAGSERGWLSLMKNTCIVTARKECPTPERSELA